MGRLRLVSVGLCAATMLAGCEAFTYDMFVSGRGVEKSEPNGDQPDGGDGQSDGGDQGWKPDPLSCGAAPTPEANALYATWPMPDSKTQGICMNWTCPNPGEHGYGQDGQKTVNAARYELALNNLAVRDLVTGLVWQRGDSGEVNNIDDYCDALVIEGLTDWRVPTRIELISLVDYGAKDPAIDTEMFPTTVSDIYRAHVGNVFGSTYTGINFASGENLLFYSQWMGRVRCVRP
jgi:hypothetical protein